MDLLITPDDINEIFQKRYKERNNCESLDNLSKNVGTNVFYCVS